MTEPGRVLLLTAATPCDAFAVATAKLRLTPVVAGTIRGSALRLNFANRDSVLEIVTWAQHHPIAALVAVDDETIGIAFRAASMLGLPTHPPKAATALAAWREKLGEAEIATAAASEQDIVLTCLVSDGRLRVLAASDPAGNLCRAPECAEMLKRLLPVLALKHGPAHIRLREAAVTGLTLAAAAPHTHSLHLFIPLVDEDVSWEEAVVRNALALDVSRIYRRS